MRAFPSAQAQVSLAPASAGGLQTALPTGTRSLMLAFTSAEDWGKEEMIGAIIDVIDGTELRPGVEGVAVVLRFWTDAATIYATPGRAFRLWYGRVVGEGVITTPL
jgi:hypothetical protein